MHNSISGAATLDMTTLRLATHNISAEFRHAANKKLKETLRIMESAVMLSVVYAETLC